MRLLFFVLLVFLSLPQSLLAADHPRVWFDQAHGQAFRIDQQGPLHLTDLASMLVTEGSIVETSRQLLDDAILSEVDGLILSGAFRPYSAKEIEAIVTFVKRGGRLAIMLHIGPPLRDLLHRLGVDFSNGVIREQQQILGKDPLNFHVSQLADHPLTVGLKGFNLYGGWALTNIDNRARLVAWTGPRAWVDLDRNRQLSKVDAMQPFGVIATGDLVEGSFVVFADDAIFQNQFLPGNVALAENLVRWLLNKDGRQVAMTGSSFSQGEKLD